MKIISIIALLTSVTFANEFNSVEEWSNKIELNSNMKYNESKLNELTNCNTSSKVVSSFESLLSKQMIDSMNLREVKSLIDLRTNLVSTSNQACISGVNAKYLLINKGL
tara:strand:+ start:249 stop:575 length:327 start_codon:yes stop_codon:yes gene_type:complete